MSERFLGGYANCLCTIITILSLMAALIYAASFVSIGLAMAVQWTTVDLYEALIASELNLESKIELNDGMEPNILVQLAEFGDLPVQITVSGAQLMVSSALWEASQVKDLAHFNEQALKLNPVNSLSNIGLITLAPGRDLYIMFGELSASSDLLHIIEEIRVLADNTIEAADVFSDQLIPSPASSTGAAT